MIQNLINHIALVVDRSGSMVGKPVVQVFDKELEQLKQRSIDLNQETRISIYLFDDKVECLAFDMDVMRFKSLRDHYYVRGSTALIDAVVRVINEQDKLPEMYGDHAFLVYVLTDGEENKSQNSPSTLTSALRDLPENWTVACLVPNATGVHEAKKFGFNADSIAIWDTERKGGLEQAGKQFSSAMDGYMKMRASGIRSTKGLFTLDSTAIKKSVLKEIESTQYSLFCVYRDTPIREFVTYWTRKDYRVGSAYYMPTKKVTIQDYKNVLVQNVKNGRVYEGSNLRELLGLPDATVDVDPGKHKDWRIFVQSTSVNRKLLQGTFVLVRK